MSEVRAKSNEELLEELRELRTELRDLRTKVLSGGAVEKPSRIREVRKRIARILTVLNERRAEEAR